MVVRRFTQKDAAGHWNRRKPKAFDTLSNTNRVVSEFSHMDARVTFKPANGRRPILLCFSHLRWDFVYQRPQHLLSRAACVYDVAFMEEPVTENVQAPVLRGRRSRENVTVLTPILPAGYSEAQAINAQRKLLQAFIESRQPEFLIFWYYAPMALAFTTDWVPEVTVYDCMDELSTFKFAPPSLKMYERELFDRADVVFTGGHSLYEAKRSYHKNIHAFPSSIDAHHFAKARSAKVHPQDVAHLKGPKLGFFGVIDERMDLDFLAEMARARPDWSFVMIGPVVKIHPECLPSLPNIHWIGGRAYNDLPDYIASWDVGIMPFAMNEATRFISPTKTPEFLAAGCPVISTPVADVVSSYGVSGLVEIASTPDEAIRCAERLMNMNRASWLAAVDQSLEGRSWDNTWANMNAHIVACAIQAGHDIIVGEQITGAARV